MNRLYGASAYDTSVWPDSHWRATASAPTCPAWQGDTTVDAVVIGAGYAGLSAALALAEAGREAVVLDAGQPGWGASGRNGGFCCMGGAKLSDKALVRRFGRDEAQAFHGFQQAAVAHVAEVLRASGIDAEKGPAGEVCLAHSEAAWGAMQGAAQTRAALYGVGTRLVPKTGLRDEGLATTAGFGAAINPVGFPLHPMKYLLGLAAAVKAAGVRIYGNSGVTALSRVGGGWRVVTARGALKTPQVLIATNGYSSENLPPWIGGRTLPAMSVILVTRPLSAAERQAQGWTSQRMAYDSRHLLHYFRLLPDNRFLFGMRGGLSADPRAEAKVLAGARRHFEALFPEWTQVETERAWSGLVCLTGSLTPYAGPVPDAAGLFAAFGWHGNGVSTASLAGHEVGRMMAGMDLRLPAVLATPPARFPMPRLRLPLLRLAYAWAGWRDGAPRGSG